MDGWIPWLDGGWWMDLSLSVSVRLLVQRWERWKMSSFWAKVIKYPNIKDEKIRKECACWNPFRLSGCCQLQQLYQFQSSTVGMCIVEHGPWNSWWPCRWGEVNHKIFSGPGFGMWCVSFMTFHSCFLEREPHLLHCQVLRLSDKRTTFNLQNYPLHLPQIDTAKSAVEDLVSFGTHHFVLFCDRRADWSQDKLQPKLWVPGLSPKTPETSTCTNATPESISFLAASLWWMFSYNQASNQNPINSCRFFPISVTGFTILQQSQVAWVASLIAPLHRKMLCMWAMEKVFFRRKEVNLKVALMRTGKFFLGKSFANKVRRACSVCLWLFTNAYYYLYYYVSLYE